MPDRDHTGPASHDRIVIGASAGGLGALLTLVKALPPDFPAAMLVVVHLSPQSGSALPDILSRSGPLPASFAVDGAPVQPGHIYVAPPDEHLLLGDDCLKLNHGPRENGVRPAVDVLFRSAARAAGPRAVGVVLSGSGDDGTEGLRVVKRAGGIAVVQDPSDALFPSMPTTAMEYTTPDYCVPAAELGPLLVRLAATPAAAAPSAPWPDGPPAPQRPGAGGSAPVAALQDGVAPSRPTIPQNLVPLTCPECGGPVSEIDDDGMTRYICLVGHGFSPSTLSVEKAREIEDALWSAVRLLDEQRELSEHLARRFRRMRCYASADRYEQMARDGAASARVLRGILESGKLRIQATDAAEADPGALGPGPW
jgi:two-component system chemotaxis response regulator CheB